MAAVNRAVAVDTLDLNARCRMVVFVVVVGVAVFAVLVFLFGLAESKRHRPASRIERTRRWRRF